MDKLLINQVEDLYAQGENAAENEDLELMDQCTEKAQSLDAENDERAAKAKKKLEYIVGENEDLRESFMDNAKDTFAEWGFTGDPQYSCEFWEIAVDTAECL